MNERQERFMNGGGRGGGRESARITTINKALPFVLLTIVYVFCFGFIHQPWVRDEGDFRLPFVLLALAVDKR